jgi:purine-binding chemotaxis protein CheW
LKAKSVEPNQRSAIVVAEVHGIAMGLVVDTISFATQEMEQQLVTR